MRICLRIASGYFERHLSTLALLPYYVCLPHSLNTCASRPGPTSAVSMSMISTDYPPTSRMDLIHLSRPGCQPGLLTVAHSASLSLRTTWVQHLVAYLTGQFNCINFLERYLTSWVAFSTQAEFLKSEVLLGKFPSCIEFYRFLTSWLMF